MFLAQNNRAIQDAIRVLSRIKTNLMKTTLAIGEFQFTLDADQALTRRIRARFGSFVKQPDPLKAISFSIACAESSASDLLASFPLPHVELTFLDRRYLILEGDFIAWFDLRDCRAVVEAGAGLAAIDTLLRISLSLVAHKANWLLLHGAAIQLESGGCALLVGDSNAGKSTAAKSFESYCDEWVLLNAGAESPRAAGTPYWNGHSRMAGCEAIFCLRKSESPDLRYLRNSCAVRALMPHIVRWIQANDTDQRNFENACKAARSIPVFQADCPTGDRYIPFLDQAASKAGFAFRRRNCDRTA